MNALPAAWVRKAENDLRAARRLLGSSEPVYEGVCFWCQQSAEKYLKAILVAHGLPVPETSDLEHLLGLLPGDHAALSRLRPGLAMLSKCDWDILYPGGHATKHQAKAALRWADRIRTEARSLLGIRPPQPRRNKSL